MIRSAPNNRFSAQVSPLIVLATMLVGCATEKLQMPLVRVYANCEQADETFPRSRSTAMTTDAEIAQWDVAAWSDRVAEVIAREELEYRERRIAHEILPELCRMERQFQQHVLAVSHREFVRRQAVFGRVRRRWTTELRTVRRRLGESGPSEHLVSLIGPRSKRSDRGAIND